MSGNNRFIIQIPIRCSELATILGYNLNDVLSVLKSSGYEAEADRALLDHGLQLVIDRLSPGLIFSAVRSRELGEQLHIGVVWHHLREIVACFADYDMDLDESDDAIAIAKLQSFMSRPESDPSVRAVRAEIEALEQLPNSGSLITESWRAMLTAVLGADMRDAFMNSTQFGSFSEIVIDSSGVESSSESDCDPGTV